MQPSTQLAHWLAYLEGMRLTAYRDTAGVLTIGVGHTAGVMEGQTITEDQAYTFLLEDMSTAAQAVNELITAPMQQWEFDAWTSFTFNLGSGALEQSSARVFFNEGNKFAAASAMTLWNKEHVQGVLTYSIGLDKRRRAEAILLLGQPWQVAKFANDNLPVLSAATLTAIMSNYA